jgi:cytochrome c biogenesis protein CcdA
MADLPFLLALAAGVLAAVNPCGFALLPAYLSLIVIDDTSTRRAAAGRALLLTAGMTAGFVAVFGVFGAVLAPVATWLPARLPWFTIGFGLLLALLGVGLLAGRHLPGLPGLRRAPALTRSLPSMVLFGMAYALASLTCTIGPFLAIVVSSLHETSPLAAFWLFIAYSVGMGLVVGAAALAVALVRTSLLTRLRRAGPVVSRLAGLLLTVAGGYVAYYGWYEVRLNSEGPRALGDPIVHAAGVVQQWLAQGLTTAGVATVFGAFVLLLAVGLIVHRGPGVGLARPAPERGPGRLAAALKPARPSQSAAPGSHTGREGGAA